MTTTIIAVIIFVIAIVVIAVYIVKRNKVYKITYDLNGGSWKEGYNNANPSYYTIEDEIILEAPSENGYEFTGWTGSNGTTPQKDVTIKKGSTGDKKFKANWKTILYKIQYNLDGGNDHNANQSSYSITSSFTLKEPTKCGYTFIGWIGSNGSSPEKTVTISNETGKRTYTAKWEKRELKEIIEEGTGNYTIEYFANVDGDLFIKHYHFNNNKLPKDLLKEFRCDDFTYKLVEFQYYESITSTSYTLTSDILDPIKSCKFIAPTYIAHLNVYPYELKTEKASYFLQIGQFKSANTCLTYSLLYSTDFIKKYNESNTFTYIYSELTPTAANQLCFDYVGYKPDNQTKPYYFTVKVVVEPDTSINLFEIAPNILIYFNGSVRYAKNYHLIVRAYNINGKLLLDYPPLENNQRKQSDLQFLEPIKMSYDDGAAYIEILYYQNENYNGPFYSPNDLKFSGIIQDGV